MFRSRRRPVVFTQADHARFSAALAAEWAEPVPLPRASFLRGVAEHDRGYGELDADDIETVADDRWIEIQRRGFAPRGEDAVVDLVVALHVRRLLSGNDPVATAEADAVIESLLGGFTREQAGAADLVTNVCDATAFSFCFEEPAERDIRGFHVVLDGEGSITLDPWPFRGAEVTGLVAAYEADGYPERLAPVAVPFRATPGPHVSGV